MIHFLFNFSEIKSERLRESQRERAKYLEGGPEGAPSTGAEAERSAFSVLRSAMRGDRASDDDNGDMIVRGLLGLVLVCALGIFFF